MADDNRVATHHKEPQMDKRLTLPLLIVSALTGTAHAAPTLAADEAQAVATEAVREQHPRARSIDAACSTLGTRARCAVEWTRGRRDFRGRVVVRLSTTPTEIRYAYRIRATSRARRRTVKLREEGRITTTRPVGASRENPIPFGQSWASGGWQITVLSTTPDATPLVLAENMFNDPPAAGSQFYMATIRATYLDPGSETFRDSRLRTVGTSNVEYTPFDHDCGVIPDPLPATDVFTSGTIEGNVCWQVRASDAIGLVMYDQPSFLDEDRVFFALAP